MLVFLKLLGYNNFIIHYILEEKSEETAFCQFTNVYIIGNESRKAD